jgi:ADP-ribosylglycohydrolase
MLSRARGCLFGQLAGDALGSLVEFQAPEQIRRNYPDGVCDLADGGTFNTIAGQPTDDSEMALGLARYLVRHRRYDSGEVRQVYIDWLNSDPFDCGNTIRAGLRGRPDPDSQANGALMRISPLGIWTAGRDGIDVGDLAEQDAALTHPHPVCLQVNRLFTEAIHEAVRFGTSPEVLFANTAARAGKIDADRALLGVIDQAAGEMPRDFLRSQGWVLIAFQNALFHLLHTTSLEDAIIKTVMQGGDTDTNAAICGALLGAVHGVEAVPARWRRAIETCRPAPENPRVHQPRPETYWPVNAAGLAAALLAAHPGSNEQEVRL